MNRVIDLTALAAYWAFGVTFLLFIQANTGKFDSFREAWRERFVYQWFLIPQSALILIGWMIGRGWANKRNVIGIRRIVFINEGITFALFAIWFFVFLSYFVHIFLYKNDGLNGLSSAYVGIAIVAFLFLMFSFIGSIMTLKDDLKKGRGV